MNRLRKFIEWGMLDGNGGYTNIHTVRKRPHITLEDFTKNAMAVFYLSDEYKKAVEVEERDAADIMLVTYDNTCEMAQGKRSQYSAEDAKLAQEALRQHPTAMPHDNS